MFDKIIFKGVCVCKTCGFHIMINILAKATQDNN
jgi:hypothetical protein